MLSSNFTLPSVLSQHMDTVVESVSRMSYLQIILTLLALALAYDQISYQLNKGLIAGQTFKFYPFIGPFFDLLDPTFEGYQLKWNSGPLLCVSIFHKFVVIALTRDLARKVLSLPRYVKPCVVDVAVKILRPSNWVFLDGKAHVDYRKSLNGLFTRQALEMYIPNQERIYDEYLEKFVKVSADGPIAFFKDFREIMCAVSLRTFCGSYITDEQVEKIADDYYLITAAMELVNFPIILPYTKTWYGRNTADMVMKVFEHCAGEAKKHIKAGGKANCVMDAWIELMEKARKDKSDNPDSKLLVREFSNREISEAIFTFLFASQDASSLATCWLFQIVADRPDVQKKIHEEQLRVRNGDPNVPLSLDLIEKMTYTNMVVKETLRYRPPVLMVPYVAKQKFPVSDTYTAPKGSMVIPTLYPALHDPEVYENPDEFIPERWVEGGAASQAKKNWLVFGTGPHVCLGQQYVMLLFTGLIGKAVLHHEIIHKQTPLSEKIKVFATIFPQDDCILQFKKRADPKVFTPSAPITA